MKDHEKFNYLFLLWGFSFKHNIGAVNSQIYSLASKLSKNKKKVGIIYISYNPVAEKYGMANKSSSLFHISSFISRILYSGFISKIILYFYKKQNTAILDSKVKLYASGIHLPDLDAEHVVTSYWWAVLLAGEIYQKESIYFIVYHDYYNDIVHSNEKNIPELQRAYSSSNLILANKELTKKFNGNYPLITEGIDIEKFTCRGTINKEPDNMVLIPLRQNPLKGAEYAIPALSMIKKEFPQIEMVAYGDYHGKIPDFIDFRHVVSENELKELYCKATYFILPSIVEGIPEPLLEAMAGGCACISTTCGGPQQVIEDGVNGILVPVKDSESIFLAFKKIYGNREMARSIMNEGKKTASKYDLNRTYNDFINAVNFYSDYKKLK